MQLITVVEKIHTEIIRNIYTLWYFLNSWTRFIVLFSDRQSSGTETSESPARKQ